MRVSVVGRDDELASIRRFLVGEDASRAFVVTGVAGVGKTTLWDAALGATAEDQVRVLAARAAHAETSLPYAGLTDLLRGVRHPNALSAPQRRALAVAMLQADPLDAAIEPRAVALAVFETLRALARRRRLVIAVDDVQWLDRRSAEALAFAVRRLRRDRVRFLLTRRDGRPTALGRAFGPEEVTELSLAGLSFGAIRSLLSQRLPAPLPRWVARRVFEVTGGNPLLAIELAQTILLRGIPQLGQELPRLESADPLGPRLSRLPASVRRLVLALALSPGLQVRELTALTDDATVEQAIDADVIVAEGHRTRLTHPLLATAALARARASDRRSLHQAVGQVALDPQRRARHLALAATAVDEQLALAVDAAASRAASRGAAEEAAELGAHAVRLTPIDGPRRAARLVSLGEKLLVSGDHEGATSLLVSVVDALPPGPHRAHAHLLLAESEFLSKGAEASEQHLAAARADSAGDPELEARAVAAWARYFSVVVVERVGEAESAVRQALAKATFVTPAAERDLVQALALARKIRGLPIDDLCRRFGTASSDAFHLRHGIERIAADRLATRGRVAEARDELERLLRVADARGEAWSAMWLRHQLCELEIRVGDWPVASRLLDELEGSPDRSLMDPRGYVRCRAQVAAGEGDVEAAMRLATQTIDACAGRGYRWNLLHARHARGMASLLAHDPRRAAADLGAVWEHVEREGVEEPAEFPVAPDYVEALIELGDVASAQTVTHRLRFLADAQEHPWGRATAMRCEGLLKVAAGEADLGMAALMGAVDAYDQLGLRFDRARTLLSAGRAARRHRRWSAARELLGQASSSFEALSSEGWATEAQGELQRVSGSRVASGESLSRAERQVVDLAAQGLSNKEIAARLVVTVNTVEKHLSHAYAKLRVRSRAQLGIRLRRGADAEDFRVSGISRSGLRR
jgi:DNA-binding CsgD family transcriptional regulator